MATKQPETSVFKHIETEDGPVPFLKDAWGFFSNKGIKTQFFSFFSDKSFKVDIEVCESLGCPIRIFTNNDETLAKWEVIRNTLKNRKVAEEDKDKEWLQGVEKKWILPKNIVVKKVPTEWNTLKTEVAAYPENRLDFLKIEGTNEEEHILLYSMLESGFRPGLLLVRFTEDPDANVPSMLVAGHLQMAGYKLCDVYNNWFLYIFTDVCLYDSCSWRNTKTQNPVAHYLAELFASQNTTKKSTAEVETPATEENKKNE
jgi:hypothetical protein